MQKMQSVVVMAMTLMGIDYELVNFMALCFALYDYLSAVLFFWISYFMLII